MIGSGILGRSIAPYWREYYSCASTMSCQNNSSKSVGELLDVVM